MRGASGVRRVVLLGPAHFVPLRGIATSSAARFDTPLGAVALDTKAIEATERLPFVSARDDAHAPEHAIEVQLPFLLGALGEVPIVPLLIGDASAADVAAAIRAARGDDADIRSLVVVSSDLSHFLPDEAARRRDGTTCEAILALEDERIDGNAACGHRALAGLLRFAREEGLRAIGLDVRTSADAGGGRRRVVGYAAFAFVRGSRTREHPG